MFFIIIIFSFAPITVFKYFLGMYVFWLLFIVFIWTEPIAAFEEEEKKPSRAELIRTLQRLNPSSKYRLYHVMLLPGNANGGDMDIL